MRLAPKENFRCPFKYQGQYYDSEVELCYNRFRYYHPETGRYISQDPIKLLGGFNVFAYVSDTNAWVDLLGLSYDNKNGAERAALYSEQWPSANLQEAINKFVGENPTISITEKGKRIYSNENSSIQIVEDLNGSYFRIYDTSISGKRKYLDMNGDIPNNKVSENGKQVGRSQAEYNQVTHFNIE